jgi:hypothetical protein
MEVTEGCRSVGENFNLCCHVNITKSIKSRTMRMMGHVAYLFESEKNLAV